MYIPKKNGEFKIQTFPKLNSTESYLYFRNTLTGGTISPVVEWRHWWGSRKSLGGTFCTHLKECVLFISYVHRDVSNFIVINDCITSLGKTSRDLGYFRTEGPPPSVRNFFFYFSSKPWSLICSCCLNSQQSDSPSKRPLGVLLKTSKIEQSQQIPGKFG